MIIINGYIVYVGHEATGVVTEIGRDVTSLSVGSRVAVENHFFCEQCYTCKVKLHIIFVGIQFYYRRHKIIQFFTYVNFMYDRRGAVISVQKWISMAMEEALHREDFLSTQL